MRYFVEINGAAHYVESYDQAVTLAFGCVEAGIEGVVIIDTEPQNGPRRLVDVTPIFVR